MFAKEENKISEHVFSVHDKLYVICPYDELLFIARSRFFKLFEELKKKEFTILIALDRFSYLISVKMVTESERGYFHWIDWLVFALMLLVSAAAGLWHFRRAQKSTTQDYLLGGRSLGLFPVSASLVAR